jgi:hypothetical protein
MNLSVPVRNYTSVLLGCHFNAIRQVRKSTLSFADYPSSYFNGAIAVTSISISMPGQANWLIFSSV